MTIVSMNYLLEAGVHFGHQKRRWNPKMKEYIYTTRDDIYIIDLQKTVKKMEEAYEAMKEIAQNGGKFLFVGTKKQAQEAAEESAVRTNMYFVNERWLGGTLTNFKTIRSRIRRMEEIETMEKDGTFEALPKKEVIKIKKEYDKLVKTARAGKEGKITKSTEVAGKEVTVKGATKASAVKEVKAAAKEAKEETVDYSKMTVAELKEVAASKEINVAGMKKAESIEALTK